MLIQVRFRGGKTHSMNIPKPLSMAQLRKTPSEIVEILHKLLETCTDQQAAEELNQRGYRNWQGKDFDVKKVAFIRQAHGLKSHYARLRARGFLRANEMAKQLGISPTTVHKWGREGLLIKEKYGRPARCLYKPLGDSAKLIKGTGGHNPQQPKFINVQLSKQETV